MKMKNTRKFRKTVTKFLTSLEIIFFNFSIKMCMCDKSSLKILTTSDCLSKDGRSWCKSVTVGLYCISRPTPLELRSLCSSVGPSEHALPPAFAVAFYRAMHVVVVRYCYRKSSVGPSVCLRR